MPRVIVGLPTGVRLPGMPEEIECDGNTVAEALADCALKEPGLKYRLFHRDGSPGVGVSVNGTNVPPEDAATVTVEEGDKIRLMPPVGAC